MLLYIVLSLVSISKQQCGFDTAGSGDTSLPSGLFSASFSPPVAPSVSTELASSFIQHKYDSNVSHITSGYWYNSAAAGNVRIDEAYDGAIGSSLFNYSDVDQTTGGVRNKVWLLEGGLGGPPSCFNEHVDNPGFPLITADILVSSNATYGGIVNDPWVGSAETWNFLYGGYVPVIAYIQNATVLVGYDFWSEYGRTKVFTRFFNIRIGNIDDSVFEGNPC